MRSSGGLTPRIFLAQPSSRPLLFLSRVLAYVAAFPLLQRPLKVKARAHPAASTTAEVGPIQASHAGAQKQQQPQQQQTQASGQTTSQSQITFAQSLSVVRTLMSVSFGCIAYLRCELSVDEGCPFSAKTGPGLRSSFLLRFPAAYCPRRTSPTTRRHTRLRLTCGRPPLRATVRSPRRARSRSRRSSATTRASSSPLGTPSERSALVASSRVSDTVRLLLATPAGRRETS
jgi:hypothetical protein